MTVARLVIQEGSSRVAFPVPQLAELQRAPHALQTSCRGTVSPPLEMPSALVTGTSYLASASAVDLVGVQSVGDKLKTAGVGCRLARVCLQWAVASKKAVGPDSCRFWHFNIWPASAIEPLGLVLGQNNTPKVI